MDPPASTEIKEVLAYIEKIQQFDQNTIIHLSSIVSLIWAFLFYFSGLLDFIFYQLGRPELTALPWFICSFFGMYIMKKIFTGSTYRPASAKIQASLIENLAVFRHFIGFLVLLWILVTVIAVLYGNFLIIPVVGLSLGIVFMIFNDNHLDYSMTNRFYRFILYHGVAYTALLSALLNIALFFVMGTATIKYMGIIMGILVGSAFLIESKAIGEYST